MSDAETLTRSYFAAVGSGDRAALERVLDADVRYRFPGRHPFARTYEDRDQVLEYLDRLRAFTGGTMRVEVRDVLVGATRCAGWVRAEARHGDAAFGWDLLALIECGEESIISIRLFYEDQHGVDSFLSSDAPCVG